MKLINGRHIKCLTFYLICFPFILFIQKKNYEHHQYSCSLRPRRGVNDFPALKLISCAWGSTDLLIPWIQCPIWGVEDEENSRRPTGLRSRECQDSPTSPTDLFLRSCTPPSYESGMDTSDRNLSNDCRSSSFFFLHEQSSKYSDLAVNKRKDI